MDQKIVGGYLKVIKWLNYGKRERKRNTLNTSVSLIRKNKTII